MKGLYQQSLPEEWQALSASLAAVSGNAVSSLIFVPKEVLKQRCQVGQLAKGRRAVGLLSEIVRKEGIGAMYNGYFATLLRNAPGAMLKFGIYEEIKSLYSSLVQRDLNPTELFGAGMTAGCISSIVTNPLDVAKTRIMLGQVQNRFPPSAIVEIARADGIKSLWRGFVPRLVWSATFFAVGISTYEVALSGILGAVVRKEHEKRQDEGEAKPGGGPGLPNPVAISAGVAQLIKQYYAPDTAAQHMKQVLIMK
mmetsp:Transcript_17410/g.26953  ORF Transcript_17410/g.26953 Transcript_17410/m.26953 type:complete len:253 (-) Transcript_17410:33-791(-)